MLELDNTINFDLTQTSGFILFYQLGDVQSHEKSRMEHVFVGDTESNEAGLLSDKIRYDYLSFYNSNQL